MQTISNDQLAVATGGFPGGQGACRAGGAIAGAAIGAFNGYHGHGAAGFVARTAVGSALVLHDLRQGPAAAPLADVVAAGLANMGGRPGAVGGMYLGGRAGAELAARACD